jgi:hypothetical protein
MRPPFLVTSGCYPNSALNVISTILSIKINRIRVLGSIYLGRS